MTHDRNQPLPARRILIVKLYGIGNALLALPAIRAVRNAYPQAVFGIICDERNEALMRATGFFSTYTVLPSRHRVTTYGTVYRAMKSFAPDMIISSYPLFHYGVALLYRLSSAATIVGDACHTPRWCYTHRTRVPDTAHEKERNDALLAVLGVPGDAGELFYPLTEKDEEAATQVWQAQTAEGKAVVGFHCGSSAALPEKRWPADYFAQVAQKLLKQGDITIMLFGGADDEEVSRAVAERVGQPVVSCVNRYPIGTVAALMKRCRVFVANDSGLMHTAAAVRTPLVALFGPTAVTKNAPVGDAARIRLCAATVPCVPCHLPGRRMYCTRQAGCMETITVDAVVRAVRSLMKG